MKTTEPQEIRMLRRFLKGECPRCSKGIYNQLAELIPDALQHESAHGADRSGGMILTHLRSFEESSAKVATWLDANGWDAAKATGSPS